MYKTYTPAITIIHMLPNIINIMEMEGAYYRNREQERTKRQNLIK